MKSCIFIYSFRLACPVDKITFFISAVVFSALPLLFDAVLMMVL